MRCRWRISIASRSSDSHHAQGREIGGMAVAGNDLGGNRLNRQPHLFGDMFFHARIDIGESADRAGNGAGGDFARAVTSRARARVNSA